MELIEVGEERLVDQIRQTKIRKWLENVQQEKIALGVRNKHQETDHNSTDASHRNRALENQEDSRDQNNASAEEDPTAPPDLEPQEKVSQDLKAL